MDTRPHIFNLIYDTAHGTVIGQREKPRPIQIGDQVVFQSSAGPVHVKLAPTDVFSAAEYYTGQPPLVVKKRAKFQYWCGVQVDGKTVGFPLNERFGHDDDLNVP
jgi:hypothetical protein